MMKAAAPRTLTVKELIEALSRYDENTLVTICGPDGAFLEVECREGQGDCLLEDDCAWSLIAN